MEQSFISQPWPGVLLWAALYCSDFFFTMACARMYQGGARERISFEGSFEITPYYQEDVDALRLFSPRFLIALTGISAMQAAVWWLTTQALFLPQVYLFVLGMLVLSQVSVHLRHIRNYFLFRAIVTGSGISGCIAYARPVILRISAIEFFAFAAAYTVIYALTSSPFVLGGVVICLSIGANHWLLAARHTLEP